MKVLYAFFPLRTFLTVRYVCISINFDNFVVVASSHCCENPKNIVDIHCLLFLLFKF